MAGELSLADVASMTAGPRMAPPPPGRPRPADAAPLSLQDIADLVLAQPSRDLGSEKPRPSPPAGAAVTAGGASTDGAGGPSLLSSAGRALGLGAREALQGLTSLPAMAYDVAATPQNLVNAGVKTLTGRDLGLSAKPGAERVGQALDAAGLPRPETTGEKLTGHVVEALSGTLGTMGAGAASGLAKNAAPILLDGANVAAPSMGARLAQMLVDKPVVQAASAVGSGLGAGLAEQAGAGPLGTFAASLLGGGLGASVPHAGNMMRVGAQAATLPFTAAGRDQIATQALLRQSAKPEELLGALRAAQLGGPAASADPLAAARAAKLEPLRLPGSPVTTAQASRDAGLAITEQGLRNNAASPGPGVQSPASVFAGIDQERNAVRARMLPEQPPEAAAAQGSQLRERLGEANAERTAEVNAAYGEIDPDGTTVIPVGGVKQTMTQLRKKYYGPLSGGLPGPIAALAGDLRRAKPVVPYQSLQNLRSRVAALQDKFGGDPRAQAVLIQLKQKIDDAGENAAVVHEMPSAPASLDDIEALYAQEGAAQRPDLVEGLGEVGKPNGTPSSRNGEPPAYEGLAQWLIDHGGIKDQGGEITHVMGDVRARPGLVNNRGGMDLDWARQLAHEAGFFGDAMDIQGADGSTVSHLVEALQSDLRTTAEQKRAAMHTVADDALDELDGRGIDASQPADGIMRAVRDPARGVDTETGQALSDGRFAPDGYEAYRDAMTPEQAAQWREATALRARQGQDFGLDQTGARGVMDVLARGPGGGPAMADQNVAARLLGSPNGVRQALRAGGPQAKATLKDALMRQAREATASITPGVDGEPVMRPGAFLRFWGRSREQARLLLPPEQFKNMETLAADFRETAASQAGGKARGSDTARNLSVAHVLSMWSGGLLPPENAFSKLAQNVLGQAYKITGAEAEVQSRLTQAMADPAVARELLEKATPRQMQRVSERINTALSRQLATGGARAAGQRLALKAGQSSTGQDNSQPDRTGARATPQDAERQRRKVLANRLSRP